MDRVKDYIGSEAHTLLLSHNISAPSQILMTHVKVIQNITGLTLDKINKVLLFVSEELLKNKIHTADQIDPWERISTGCKGLDAILLGGIPINGISEIYGFSGVGKTQFCLQLALNIQLPNQLGGKRKEVIYICTEDVFPSKRLHQLANAYRKRHDIKINFEDHIYLKHIADSAQLQKCLLIELPYFLLTKNIGLIIIDSIAGVFRSENENSNYVSRSHELNKISKSLNKLQDLLNCGIVTINQVTDNLSDGSSDPCLGLSWANNVTNRFCFSRNNNSPIRTFQVIFAPDLPVKSSNLIITPEGLLDV